jgi:catechol 2,3-dioxygenase-like lactoylglutathione lyase family enzyme
VEHIVDHLGIVIRDFERAKAFYSAALAPLAISLLREFEPVPGFRVGGFGRGQKAEFWFSTPKGASAGELTPVHVCFGAKSRDEVDAFYKAAIAAGGRDNGAPGVRELYHPNYYGAFVLDPDGHNIEAVHHGF